MAAVGGSDGVLIGAGAELLGLEGGHDLEESGEWSSAPRVTYRQRH